MAGALKSDILQDTSRVKSYSISAIDPCQRILQQ